MKTILALIAALCFASANRAEAAEYHAYLATVSLPMLDGEYVSGNDRIVTTRLSTKQLINLALGRTFAAVVPPEQTLVLLVPKEGPRKIHASSSSTRRPAASSPPLRRLTSSRFSPPTM